MSENANKGRLSLPYRENDGQSLRRLYSHELFDGNSRLLIEHDGINYLLQITRQGKLLLTK